MEWLGEGRGGRGKGASDAHAFLEPGVLVANEGDLGLERLPPPPPLIDCLRVFGPQSALSFHALGHQSLPLRLPLASPHLLLHPACAAAAAAAAAPGARLR